MGDHNITPVLDMSRTMVLCAYRTEVLPFPDMKYGERLKAARKKAGLSQIGLAEKARVGTQENVSKLERGSAEGSEFTVQYAAACDVNPYWLATGEGDMTQVTRYDRLTERVIQDMQCMREEEKRYIVTTAEFLLKHKQQPAYDGPQRRENNESPNPERRWGEIYYEGATDWEHDSTEDTDSPRRKQQ